MFGFCLYKINNIFCCHKDSYCLQNNNNIGGFLSMVVTFRIWLML